MKKNRKIDIRLLYKIQLFLGLLVLISLILTIFYESLWLFTQIIFLIYSLYMTYVYIVHLKKRNYAAIFIIVDILLLVTILTNFIF